MSQNSIKEDDTDTSHMFSSGNSSTKEVDTPTIQVAGNIESEDPQNANEDVDKEEFIDMMTRVMKERYSQTIDYAIVIILFVLFLIIVDHDLFTVPSYFQKVDEIEPPNDCCYLFLDNQGISVDILSACIDS